VLKDVNFVLLVFRLNAVLFLFCVFLYTPARLRERRAGALRLLRRYFLGIDRPVCLFDFDLGRNLAATVWRGGGGGGVFQFAGILPTLLTFFAFTVSFVGVGGRIPCLPCRHSLYEGVPFCLAFWNSFTHFTPFTTFFPKL